LAGNHSFSLALVFKIPSDSEILFTLFRKFRIHDISFSAPLHLESATRSPLDECNLRASHSLERANHTGRKKGNAMNSFSATNPPVFSEANLAYL
jgi:hypothetical protein